MTYHSIDSVVEIPPGTMKSVTANEIPVLLANINGDYHAIQRKCPHMGADLGQGRLVGFVVTCPKHAAGFDVRTGKAVSPFKMLFLKFKPKDAKTYPVKIEGGTLLVGME